jgi:hypothetical protein
MTFLDIKKTKSRCCAEEGLGGFAGTGIGGGGWLVVVVRGALGGSVIEEVPPRGPVTFGIAQLQGGGKRATQKDDKNQRGRKPSKWDGVRG